MIELRKMENRKFRTFGWVQDPSDFKSLYNVVAIFDNTSEVHKQLVDERIEKLIEEKDGRSHFLEVMRSKPLKIKYTDLIGTAFTPRSSARCNGIVQATVEGQKRKFISDWPADNFVRWAHCLGFIQYNYEDDTFEITEKGTATAEVLHPTSQEKIVFYLQNVPFGIQKMSGTIKGLVETSSNIGILRLDRDELFASSSVRSSVDAACSALSDKIEYLTEFLGGDYEVQGAYPAWEYRKESPLRDKMVAVFEEMYGHKPEVVAIHAGLECGLFYKKMEGLDCVSLGPDMKDIHTSEEVLSIASTERVWNYLVQVLKNLKD